MIGEPPPEPLGGSAEDRRHHWVVPVGEGSAYVPAAEAVAAIVEGLASGQWLRWEPRPPYDPDRPFYYSTFAGTSDRGEPVAADRVIRRSHCQTIGVMVTDALLVAPTARAHASNVACSACGKPLLSAPESGKSRLVPSACAACAAMVTPSELGTLPLFRFAVVIELWHPRAADTGLSVDPDLLRLLQDHFGHAFRDEGQ